MSEVTLHILLACVSFVAGTIDAMAGGGGLLTVPALLLAGLPPHTALATNKIQSVCGASAATYRFVRGGAVRVQDHWASVVTVFAGAAVGAGLMLCADADFLRNIIPVVLIAIALYFVFGPKISHDTDSAPRWPRWAFVGVLAPLIGAYDGFFGPSTGSFFILALVTTQGYALRKAVGTTRLLNLTSNLTSVLVFVTIGTIDWSIAACMAVGQICGGTLGAHLALGKGIKLIRPLLVIVCIVTSLRMLFWN